MYTVPDLLATQARRRPQQMAVIDGTTSLSYSELYDLARRCATMVARRTEPGERVAILLPRGADALAVFFGAQLAAAVPVFVSEQLRPRQVAYIVRHADARLLITGGRHRGLLRDAHLPADAILDLATLREGPLPTAAPLIGRDLATLIYTSGSTGTPKGVTITHDNLVAGATIVADYLYLTDRDRTIAALPWSFDYGLNQVLATFAAGGTVIIQRSTFAPNICRTLAAAEVTGIAAVPSLWATLTGVGSPFLKQRLPSLRYITNTGGALALATIGQIRAGHPHIDVYLMYGLTEAFRSTYLDPAMIDARPGSIGKAMPDTQIMVIGDDGQPCPPGVVGELVHRGPTVASGYWQDPEAGAAVFRPHPLPMYGPTIGETVVYSGDYVKTDADGYLYYVGRRDEMFKSRGVRITPTEIETEMLASGMVSEAVVAVMDRDGPDPIVVAAIVPNDLGFTLDKLDAYCRAELPAHLQPDRIVPMTAMPTGSSGKTARATVRAELTARAAQSQGQR